MIINNIKLLYIYIYIYIYFKRINLNRLHYKEKIILFPIIKKENNDKRIQIT